jgi:hypothetical protein
VRAIFRFVAIGQEHNDHDEMAAYRKTKIHPREDAAYVAGVIDGEVTIALSRKHPATHVQAMVPEGGQTPGTDSFP